MEDIRFSDDGCWRFFDPGILGSGFAVDASQQTFFIVSSSHAH